MLRQIFALYAQPDCSLGDVAASLRAQGITNRRGACFSRSRLRDLIINPIYVRADDAVCRFFRAQGAEVVNPAADFIGVNGAYLYTGGTENGGAGPLSGRTLVLAPHEGIVEADIWLRCRAKCLRSQRAAKPVEARRTWLAGKLKCGYCGRALTVKCGKRKRGADVRYFLCSGKNTAGSGCAFRSLHADAVEALVLDALRDKLAGLPVLRPRQPPAPDGAACRLQAQLDAADCEIAALMRQLAGAGEALASYIDRRVSALEEEKAALCRRNQRAGAAVRGRAAAHRLSQGLGPAPHRRPGRGSGLPDRDHPRDRDRAAHRLARLSGRALPLSALAMRCALYRIIWTPRITMPSTRRSTSAPPEARRTAHMPRPEPARPAASGEKKPGTRA